MDLIIVKQLFSDLGNDWVDWVDVVSLMSLYQVAVSDGPLLGHESERRQEVVIPVRERVPPLVHLSRAVQPGLLLPLHLGHGCFVLLPPPPTPSSLPLTDIQQQQDDTADDKKDDTNIDRGLAAESPVNHGVQKDSESENWSL